MICQDCSSELTRLPENDFLFCASCNVVDLPGAPDAPATQDDHQEKVAPVGQPTDFLCPVCPDHNLQVGDLFGTQVCFAISATDS